MAYYTENFTFTFYHLLYNSFSIAQCCHISLVLEFMKQNNWL